jgi:hypothetical protein
VLGWDAREGKASLLIQDYRGPRIPSLGPGRDSDGSFQDSGIARTSSLGLGRAILG